MFTAEKYDTLLSLFDELTNHINSLKNTNIGIDDIYEMDEYDIYYQEWAYGEVVTRSINMRDILGLTPEQYEAKLAELAEQAKIDQERKLREHAERVRAIEEAKDKLEYARLKAKYEG